MAKSMQIFMNKVMAGARWRIRSGGVGVAKFQPISREGGAPRGHSGKAPAQLQWGLALPGKWQVPAGIGLVCRTPQLRERRGLGWEWAEQETSVPHELAPSFRLPKHAILGP